jgi:hypothetical protein
MHGARSRSPEQESISSAATERGPFPEKMEKWGQISFCDASIKRALKGFFHKNWDAYLAARTGLYPIHIDPADNGSPYEMYWKDNRALLFWDFKRDATYEHLYDALQKISEGPPQQFQAASFSLVTKTSDGILYIPLNPYQRIGKIVAHRRYEQNGQDSTDYVTLQPDRDPLETYQITGAPPSFGAYISDSLNRKTCIIAYALKGDASYSQPRVYNLSLKPISTQERPISNRPPQSASPRTR